jgi:hypothetical protein
LSKGSRGIRQQVREELRSEEIGSVVVKNECPRVPTTHKDEGGLYRSTAKEGNERERPNAVAREYNNLQSCRSSDRVISREII